MLVVWIEWHRLPDTVQNTPIYWLSRAPSTILLVHPSYFKPFDLLLRKVGQSAATHTSRRISRVSLAPDDPTFNCCYLRFIITSPSYCRRFHSWVPPVTTNCFLPATQTADGQCRFGSYNAVTSHRDHRFNFNFKNIGKFHSVAT